MSSYKVEYGNAARRTARLRSGGRIGRRDGAETVTLTAAPTTANLPDGQGVPMWGYTCSAPSANVSCPAINSTASAWKPLLIRVPAGPLTITLVNSLPVPTSIVIDGQVGGGLGDAPTRMASPVHAPQGTTWPGTAGDGHAVELQQLASTGGSGHLLPAGAGRSCSFLCDRSRGRRNQHHADLDQPASRHLPDPFGHRAVDPASDGPVWNPDRNGQHRANLHRGHPDGQQCLLHGL